MKNNQLAQMLLFVLLLSALFSGWLVLRYTSSVRQLQQMQAELPKANLTRNFVQTLVNESMEYSKKNPDIKHVLQPGAPAAKPPASVPVSGSPVSK